MVTSRDSEIAMRAARAVYFFFQPVIAASLRDLSTDHRYRAPEVHTNPCWLPDPPSFRDGILLFKNGVVLVPSVWGRRNIPLIKTSEY